ncbi:hypothetical protein H671_3g9230 [Cricetulus griseus]|nr:hypothetical protein H671_3g9230 [Cricetulus griseus]
MCCERLRKSTFAIRHFQECSSPQRANSLKKCQLRVKSLCIWKPHTLRIHPVSRLPSWNCALETVLRAGSGYVADPTDL